MYRPLSVIISFEQERLLAHTHGDDDGNEGEENHK